MKNHRLICITVFSAFLLLICAQVINAQEVEHDILFSTSARISYKPYKFLKLNIVPEFRFNDSFTPKRISAEFQVDYQPIKFLKISASYGLVSKNPFSPENENYRYYALGTDLNVRVYRFEPSFSLRYIDYSDDDIKGNFLRYDLQLGYDIKNCKYKPYIDFALWQSLNENVLYKTRYRIGLERELFKNHKIGLSYQLDYYLEEYKNRHMFSLDYRYRF